MPLKTQGNKCNKCSNPAKYYDKKKWWCGFTMDAHGYCKAEKESKNDKR